MGDAGKLPGSLMDAGAAKLGHAVLGDDAVHDVLERGDRGSCATTRETDRRISVLTWSLRDGRVLRMLLSRKGLKS